MATTCSEYNCYVGNLDIVRLLLDFGADIDYELQEFYSVVNGCGTASIL